MRWFSMGLCFTTVTVLARSALAAQTPPPAPTPTRCNHIVPRGSFLDENRVVRDSAGNVIADYSAPCPAALAGASTSDPRGPYDEYVLAYLDENTYSMWSGLYSTWKVPANKPAASSDQAVLWSTRIIGSPIGSTDLLFLEAGVSYGQWMDLNATTTPGGTGLIPGSYNAWAAVRPDPNDTFYTTPVAVQPGAVVEVDIILTGFRQPNPPVEQPQVAIYDPGTYLLWNINMYVDGVGGSVFSVSTPSLGSATYTAAEPGVMSIWNFPGTGVATCEEALPSDGSMAIGPFEFATSDPTSPTTLNWGPSSQSIVNYGSLPGTPHLNCPLWNPNTNVLLSRPDHATLTWATTTTAASPPIVPAVPHAVLAGLGLVLALFGARSLRKARRS
jgi:hypothetical protein